ncbi:retrovirus-related pol polyprotein from transposon TNT 1-94, partial [Tanacetum coccineum]
LSTSFIASANHLHELVSYREAVCDPRWQIYIAKELAALNQNQTYMRLGYAQAYGIYYAETFSIAAKMTTVRTLIVVASSRKWKMSQLDVKYAFLNGDVNEEVFMASPPTVVTSLGFVSSHRDSALFVKHSRVGHIILSLYVDDMIITGDDSVGIESLKSELAYHFAMKVFGLLRYFLAFYVSQVCQPSDIHSTKRAYIGLDVFCTFPYVKSSAGTQFQTLLFSSMSALDMRAYSEYRAMAVTTSDIV